jgi:putative transposase
MTRRDLSRARVAGAGRPNGIGVIWTGRARAPCTEQAPHNPAAGTLPLDVTERREVASPVGRPPLTLSARCSSPATVAVRPFRDGSTREPPRTVGKRRLGLARAPSRLDLSWAASGLDTSRSAICTSAPRPNVRNARRRCHRLGSWTACWLLSSHSSVTTSAASAVRQPAWGVLRQLEVSESSWNRWRAQYGGMKANEAKRLRELEIENARLKKLSAEAELDKAMLKELAEGNF